MKKIFLSSVLSLLLAMTAFGQKATESNEKGPMKEPGNAIVISLEGQAKNVENVLDREFKKLKSKNEKGYTSYKGQIFSKISPDMLDYYYKVEKMKDNEAKIIFFISKGYDNFLSSKDNPQEVGKAMEFLNTLVREVRVYELELAIEEQTKTIEKAVGEMEDLQKDQDKLVKEQEKLEKEVADNKKAQEDNKKSQEDQKKVVEEEKKTLEELQKSLNKVGK